MRRRSYPGFLPLLARSFSLLAFALCAALAIGQDGASPSPAAAAPASPADLHTLMLKALKSNGLTGADLPPWHLKVSFRVLDDEGKPKDSGTYEEFWVSPGKYRQSYTSAGFSQTDYGTANGIMRIGEPKWTPYLLRQIRRAFVDPLPHEDQLEGARLISEKHPNMLCVRKLNKPNPPGTQPTISTYCFAGETSALRMTLTGIENGQIFPLFRATRPQTLTFMGRALPSDLLVAVNANMKNSMITHLDTIEAIANVDETVFLSPSGAIPPPEASSVTPSPVSLDAPAFLGGNNQPPLPAGTAISSSVSAGLLIRKVDPVYPAIAEARQDSRSV